MLVATFENTSQGERVAGRASYINGILANKQMLGRRYELSNGGRYYIEWREYRVLEAFQYPGYEKVILFLF